MNSFTSNLTHSLQKWNVRILAIAVVLGMTLCCSSVFAQSGAGSIQGHVSDPTGAVIPGASINVVQQGTNATSNTVSNEVGFFQVPQLFTGTYVVTITAPGMKTYKTTVQLQVAQAANISPVMVAGAVTEKVEVAADVIQLTTTDNGTISSTLENDRINQLPLNGRLLLNLAGATTPGLESTGQRANGLMPEAMEYVQDGAPLSNRNFGGVGNSTQAQLPDPDAVQEVRMETTNTSAMYSSPATGLITTKSGTNGIHGSLFETARNNAIGIGRGRQDKPTMSAPHLVRNEFGASMGGPVVLPKLYHGKDKSFWFFAFERYSLAQSAAEVVFVPSMAWRAGDFSTMTNSSGALQTLYDSATTRNDPNCNGSGVANTACRTPYTNNQIPIGRLAPATKQMYDITPKPTTTDNPLVTSNITFFNPIFVHIPTETFRLDHSFNENNKAYVRFTNIDQKNRALRNYPSNTPMTIASGGFPEGAEGFQNINVTTISAAIGFTHVFSPTFFSETVLSQQWEDQFVGGGDYINTNFEKALGLPNNFGSPGFPSIGSSNPTLVMPYGGSQYSYKENQIIFNYDENLTKIVGRHQMQFGGRYRRERFQYLPDRAADSVNFSNQATGLLDPTTGTSVNPTNNTGQVNADFFVGAASSYTVAKSAPVAHFHDMEFDGYFQDNFHMSRNLTWNLGFRYEGHPAPWVKNGLETSFDLKNKAMVLEQPISYYIANGYTTQAIVTNLTNLGVKFESPAQAGFPNKMIRDRNFTLSPRVGVAYTPFNGKHGTVIRGAYGRYIYPVPTRNFSKVPVANPPFTAAYTQSYTDPAFTPGGLTNYLLRAPQTVIMGQNSANVVDTNQINAIKPGFGLGTINPDSAPDYVTQVNFTVEQPMKGNSALRLTWLWSHGTNLDHLYYYNNHPSEFVWKMNTGTAVPQGTVIGSNQYQATATGPYDQTTYGGSNMITKTGWSNDNALQANYQKLFNHGVAYQMSYVWSKPFRVGGNTFRDGNVYTSQNNYPTGNLGVMSLYPNGSVTPGTLPPARPQGIASYADWHALERFQNYEIDPAIPMQHITFNGVVDLPFGRGKKHFGNANRAMDALVGGWQIAGDGNVFTQRVRLGAGNWGPTHPLKYFKKGLPVTDCRSGVCHAAYQWFNGYVAPQAREAGLAAGCSKVVTGLRSSEFAYSQPIDTNYNPAAGTICGKAQDAHYNTNDVLVTLADGSAGNVPYASGPNNNNQPFYHMFLNGPINWTTDLSVFKIVKITEKTSVRFNVDAFNALNVQGYQNPNATDGIQQVEPGTGVASSFNTPRQVQFTLRLTF
jgi:hypothetical protein